MDSTWSQILIITLFCFGFLWLKSRTRNNSLRYSAEIRGEYPQATFIEYFQKKGYAQKDIESIYEEIKTYVPTKRFTMHPDDKLVDDYEIDDEDLLEFAIKLYEEKFNKGISKKEMLLAEKAGSTILTFEGILIFLSKDWSH